MTKEIKKKSVKIVKESQNEVSDIQHNSSKNPSTNSYRNLSKKWKIVGAIILIILVLLFLLPDATSKQVTPMPGTSNENPLKTKLKSGLNSLQKTLHLKKNTPEEDAEVKNKRMLEVVTEEVGANGPEELGDLRTREIVKDTLEGDKLFFKDAKVGMIIVGTEQANILYDPKTENVLEMRMK